MLTEHDKTKIAAEVALAEQGTAGEVVVVLTKRSADYAWHRSVAAVVLTTVGVWELLNLIPAEHHAFVLLAQVPLFFLLFALFGTPPLLRLIASRQLRQQMVIERAARAFIEEGVTETRDRSGVLIFLSETERQVTIMADKGINDRVAPSEWQSDVEGLVAAIRQGRAGDGVIAVVTRVGDLLASAFPPRADDTNELPDAVREVE